MANVKLKLIKADLLSVMINGAILQTFTPINLTKEDKLIVETMIDSAYEAGKRVRSGEIKNLILLD